MTFSSAALTPRYPAAVEVGRPLWREVAFKSNQWESVLGASGFLTRAIRYGVLDMPTVPFTHVRVLP